MDVCAFAESGTGGPTLEPELGGTMYIGLGTLILIIILILLLT